MRKVLVASVAIVTLVLAGALVASPKITNNGYRASALDLDLLGLTQRARDLPEQVTRLTSYRFSSSCF